MKQILFILLFSIAPLSWADDELPPCEGDQMTWTACSYTYADGNEHVGQWKDDLKHGQGTLTYNLGGSEFWNSWKNGDKYVGQCKDDKQHGEGTYTYTYIDGSEYVGEWQDGKLPKYITVFKALPNFEKVSVGV